MENLKLIIENGSTIENGELKVENGNNNEK